MGTAAIILGSFDSPISLGTTNSYWSLGSCQTQWTTETNVNETWRTAGVFSKMSTYVVTNALTATLSIGFRDNATSVNQQVSYSSSATGLQQDTTHTDTVTVGHNYNFIVTCTDTTHNIDLCSTGVLFTASSNVMTKMTTFDFSNNGSGRTAASTTSPTPMNGFDFADGTEANSQIKAFYAATLSDLQINMKQNSRSTATTLTTRKSAANQNLTISIAGGSTGIHEDTTHTDSVAVNDLWNTAITTGTGSGTFQYYIQATETSNTSAASDMTETGTDNGVTGVNLGTSKSFYDCVQAENFGSLTETDVRFPSLTTFTYQNMGCFVNANTISATCNYTLRQNATNTTLSASITASSNGFFVDTTHTYASAASDYITMAMNTGASGTSMTYSTKLLWGTLGGTLHTASISETETVSEAEKKLAIKKAITDTETVSESETKLRKVPRTVQDAAVIATSSIATYTQPLYAYPDWYDGVNYSWLQFVRVALENPHLPFIAVINPDSGPGTGLNSDFTHGISDLQTAPNIKILGYVFTNFGARTQADVETDIDSYATWYPTINGIMLDQMASATGSETYYSGITSYAHGHAGVSFNLVIANAGTSVASSYVGTVDVITIYENNSFPSEATLQSNTFYPTYPKTNFSMTAYDVSSPPTAAQITYAAKYCEYIFVTDWNDFFHNPTYIDDEVQLMETGSEAVKMKGIKAISESETVSEAEKKKAIKKAIAEPTQTVSEAEKKKGIKHFVETTQSVSEALTNVRKLLVGIADALKTKIAISPR